MQIVEIFESIQGEGPFIGQPAVFIRTYGCVAPLCSWCDSQHAIKGDQYRDMSIRDIMTAIRYKNSKLVVLTGGEPLIQKDCAELLHNLLAADYRVQVETSGKVSFMHEQFAAVHYVVSPKQYKGVFHIESCWLSTVGPVKNPNLYYKFVVSNKEDVIRIDNFASACGVLSKCYLMPEGVSRKEQVKKLPQVSEWCITYGFKLSPRLHILTWDTKKGV